MMREYYQLLRKNELLKGIAETEIELLLNCLQGKQKSFHKGQWIYAEGEPVAALGILLSGMVQIIQEDTLGNRMILAALQPGDLFGEAYACAQVEELPVSVLAATDAEVLLIDYRRIITTCPSACRFHGLVIENMLQILAVKNIQLNKKMGVLSKRSTRDKLLAYLSEAATGRKGIPFEIPFNRQELADYLCVERSAMCGELSRMKKDCLIDYHKNTFRLF